MIRRPVLGALLVWAMASLVAAPARAQAQAEVDSQRWKLTRPEPGIPMQPLTDGELRAVHEQALGSEYRLTCLSWLYMGTPAEAQRPFGVALPPLGVAAKIDGTVRTASGLRPDRFDQARSSTGRLAATVIVQDFGPAFSLRRNSFPMAPVQAYQLHIHSDRLKVVHKAARCRQAKAHCRVYAGPATAIWLSREESLRPADAGMAGGGQAFELTVEDMCPATTLGSVEGPWRQARDIGAGAADWRNRIVKGIVGNPALATALKRP